MQPHLHLEHPNILRCPIKLQIIYLNGKLCKYSTKIKVNRSEWDLSNQRPKVKRGAAGAETRTLLAPASKC